MPVIAFGGSRERLDITTVRVQLISRRLRLTCLNSLTFLEPSTGPDDLQTEKGCPQPIGSRSPRISFPYHERRVAFRSKLFAHLATPSSRKTMRPALHVARLTALFLASGENDETAQLRRTGSSIDGPYESFLEVFVEYSHCQEIGKKKERTIGICIV